MKKYEVFSFRLDCKKDKDIIKFLKSVHKKYRKETVTGIIRSSLYRNNYLKNDTTPINNIVSEKNSNEESNLSPVDSELSALTNNSLRMKLKS